MCIAGLLCLPFEAQATGATVPFADGFESYTNAVLTNNDVASRYWSLTGADAQATVTNNPYTEGVKGCGLSDANLTLNVNAGIYTNIWCQMYIKSEGYDDQDGRPTVTGNVAVGVYVATNGQLRAYIFNGSSNDWTNAVFVSTSCWVGVAMHLDYTNHTWDLYYTTNGYGASMTKANGTAYWMATNAANAISAVTFQNGGTLDAVAVSEGSTCVTNSPASPGKLISMELAGGKTNLLGILAHHYGPGQDTLAGALGVDLKSGFAQGDRIGVHYTNGWNLYTLQAGGAWGNDPGSWAPGDLHITSGMGLKAMRANPTNAVVCYSYDTVSNISVGVYGTNYYVGGWNLLTWPFVDSENASVRGWGVTNWAGKGDAIYLYDNGYFVWLSYDHIANRWMQGGRPSSYTMTRGQAFWYYRKTTGTVTWAISP